MFDVQLLVVIKKKSLYDIKPMIKYNNIIYNNFRREFVKTENNKYLFHVFYQQDVHVACDPECIVIETKI